MALINCPECNKQISDKAEICVGCGAPVEKPTLLKIGNLEIAPNEFPSKMNWQNAKKACEALGNGWRLPTRDEMYILNDYKDKIGGFASLGGYWTSEVYGQDGDTWWVQDFFNGYQNRNWDNKEYVRAVRTI